MRPKMAGFFLLPTSFNGENSPACIMQKTCLDILLTGCIAYIFNRELMPLIPFTAVAGSTIGGSIPIYSCPPQLISFGIDCFYGV